MNTKPFITEFYEDVETISEGFLSGRDYEEPEIQDFLDEEFDEIIYHLEPHDSTKEHMKTAFGLSYLVAIKLSKDADNSHFFKERAEDFRQFYEDIGYNSPRFGKNELVQFGNLYSGLADIEDLDIEKYPARSLVLDQRDEVADKVSDMLSELAQEY